MQSIAVNNRPIVVVAGIIRHPITQKILISRRKDGQHLAGYWEFPGGKIELGEDGFHALQRELMEELGIYIQSAIPFKQICHDYKSKSVVLQFWDVKHFSGDAIGAEGQEIRWVKKEELTSFDFPDANKAILKAIQLSSYWMITPDCHMEAIDTFLKNIQKAIKKYHVTQLLFRSKNLSDVDYFLVYEQLKTLCFSYHCHLILNRDEIAIHSEHTSWHLTSIQLYQFKERPISKSDFLSASCHTMKDIKQAELLKLDCIFLSPVLATTSHLDAETMGWKFFKDLALQTNLLVYALGGVTKKDFSLARYNGAIGIAGISCFKAHNE